MNPKNQRHPVVPGKVMISVLLYGALGIVLSAGLHWVGFLGQADQKIFNLLHGPVFHHSEPLRLAFPGLFLVTMILCFGIAYSVLDTSGMWRRAGLGLTLLVLIAGVVPTLAVWDFYFPPTMSLVGVFWTWFACLVYSSHHQMPCDVVRMVQQPAPVIETASLSQMSELAPLPVSVDEESKLSMVKNLIQEFAQEKSEQSEPDPDAKYKPKE